MTELHRLNSSDIQQRFYNFKDSNTLNIVNLSVYAFTMCTEKQSKRILQ